MKYLIIIILITFSTSCKTQITSKKTKVKPELKPPFSNQGEQENYWAQELFKKEYKKEFYPKYNGEIRTFENKFHFTIGIQTVEFLDLNSEYNLIFKNGILYPKILNKQYLKIGSLTKLEFLSNDPKIKRFRFWLYQNGTMNPQVYIFELTNENANKNTEWKSFVKNAKLTFIKNGWIII